MKANAVIETFMDWLFENGYQISLQGEDNPLTKTGCKMLLKRWNRVKIPEECDETNRS